jgi:hypothetical protein
MFNSRTILSKQYLILLIVMHYFHTLLKILILLSIKIMAAT